MQQPPLTYRSLNAQAGALMSNYESLEGKGTALDPELVYVEKELDMSIEEEIKEGFFELKQKFKSVGPSSIYISHVVLHEKHPIFKKMEIDTLKTLLVEASVVYLSKD